MTGYTDQEFRQILDRNREERAEMTLIAMAAAAISGAIVGIIGTLLVMWI